MKVEGNQRRSHKRPDLARERVAVAAFLLLPVPMTVGVAAGFLASSLEAGVAYGFLIGIVWSVACLWMMLAPSKGRTLGGSVCVTCGYPRVAAAGETPAICPECGAAYD